MMSAEGTGIPVPVITIDSLGLMACKLIKADVEGMEAQVLRGAQASIARSRPILYLENSVIERSQELLMLLDELGHSAYWSIISRFRRSKYRQHRESIFGVADVDFNIPALPNRRFNRGQPLLVSCSGPA